MCPFKEDLRGGGVLHMKSILANCFEFTVFSKLLLEFISDELVFLIGFLKKRGGGTF